MLADGSVLCLRPLEPGDRATVGEVFAGLGERSRRLRFHGPKPELTDAELSHLAAVDHRDRTAVVAYAEGSGKPVALGELVRDRDDRETAEVAFAVVDGWQGRGLGGVLADRLAGRARALGVSRVRAFVAASNDAAAAVVRRIGTVVGSGVEDGAFELVVDVGRPRA